MPTLNIPAGAKCLTPGCGGEATHMFSIRMRRADTGASWAPNIPDALFCDTCALEGAYVDVTYVPKPTGRADITVYATPLASGRGPVEMAIRRYKIPRRRR